MGLQSQLLIILSLIWSLESILSADEAPQQLHCAMEETIQDLLMEPLHNKQKKWSKKMRKKKTHWNVKKWFCNSFKNAFWSRLTFSKQSVSIHDCLSSKMEANSADWAAACPLQRVMWWSGEGDCSCYCTVIDLIPPQIVLASTWLELIAWKVQNS